MTSIGNLFNDFETPDDVAKKGDKRMTVWKRFPEPQFDDNVKSIAFLWHVNPDPSHPLDVDDDLKWWKIRLTQGWSGDNFATIYRTIAITSPRWASSLEEIKALSEPKAKPGKF